MELGPFLAFIIIGALLQTPAAEAFDMADLLSMMGDEEATDDAAATLWDEEMANLANSEEVQAALTEMEEMEATADAAATLWDEEMANMEQAAIATSNEVMAELMADVAKWVEQAGTQGTEEAEFMADPMVMALIGEDLDMSDMSDCLTKANNCLDDCGNSPDCQFGCYESFTDCISGTD